MRKFSKSTIVLFVIFQRQFVAGIAQSGIKG